MLKYLVVLCMCLCVNQAAKAGAKPWPGVEYKTVKVFLYNLDDRLFGQHQPVKQGKLDTSVIQPGATLTQEQLDRVLKLSNENTNLLEIGLASCYLPHHAFVFFDANDKPVAWISICFMCDAARFFPNKKLNEKEVSNPKKEKAVLDQLERLKKVVTDAGLPVYKDSPGYNAHLFGLNHPKIDSVDIEAHNFSKEVQSFMWAKQGFNQFSGCEGDKDSTVKIAAGGRHYYFFSAKTAKSEIRYSRANQSFLPDYARITEKCFNAVIPNIKIGDSVFTLTELLRSYGLKPRSGNLFIVKDPEAHVQYSFTFRNEMLTEIKIDMY